MWFNRDPSGNTQGAASYYAKALFAFDGNNAPPYKRVWATLGQLNDNITQIQFTRNHLNTGAPEVVYTTDFFVEPNTWNHLLITFNGNIAKVYLNNIALTTIYSGSPIMSNSMLGPDNDVIGFTIGDNNQNNIENFSGKIDDIGVWNRALTQEEVTSLYYADNTCQSLVINTGVLSFNPPTYQNTVTIYPNPANDQITIDCGTLANVTGWKVKISNALGQEVFVGAMNTQQHVVPLNSWGGQGIYFVKIYDASNNLMNTKKIILQ